MPEEFLTPNWHVVCVHFPIALLVLGLIIEIVSFARPQGGFRKAGRWMILLGALSLIPTATAGIYAYRDVVTPAPVSIEAHWQDVLAQSHWSDSQWELIGNHIWVNSVATVILVVVVVLWLAGADEWRRRAYLPLLAAAIVGILLMLIGAWHGGEMVYRYGTGVAWGHAAAGPIQGGVRYYLPPLELHLALVGLAVSFGVVALGLMIRRWKLESLPPVPMDIEPGRPAVPAVSPPAETFGQPDRAELRSSAPPGAERAAAAEPPTVHPGWFWLGTILLAAAAAVAGAWSVMGQFTRQAWQRNLEELWEQDHRRLLAHVVFGLGIILLLLVLAGLVRFARHWRKPVVVLAAVLLVLAATQLWLGVLMTFDSHSGSLFGFTSIGEAARPHVHEPAPSEAAPSSAPMAPHEHAAPPEQAVPPEPLAAPETQPAAPVGH